MFNALNRFIARLDSDAPQQSAQNTFGFQVLRNNNKDLHVEPWFDFIIGINGRIIEDADPNLFAQEVRNCAGGAVNLSIWSAKGQTTRHMSVSISHENPSLGLSLQFAPLSLTHTIWHILSVPPSSPAATATLLPYSDYILGTPLGTLHSESALSELVDEYLNRPLPLWVYNSEYDVVRKITIVPSREWGGEGALGCTLGFGALHRIPAPLSEPVAGPGETLFSGDQGYPDEKADLHFANVTAPPQQFHVPAMEGGRLGTPELLHAQPVGHAPVVRHAPRKREKVVRGKGLAIDDYFNEGEAKSRALDYGSGKSANTPPPPPPKAGGPPRAGGAGPPMGGPPRSGSQGPSPPKANSPSREMACSPELTPGSGVVTPSAQQAIPDDAPAPWDAVDDKGGDRPETGKSEKSVD